DPAGSRRRSRARRQGDDARRARGRGAALTLAYLGLGANVGDREAHLEADRRELERAGAATLRAPDAVETEPFGGRGQPRCVREGLRVAWLGHQTAALGGGIATYSNETIARLRKRGVRVTFFHHEAREKTGAADPADEVALAAVPIMRSLVLSPPSARRALVQ